MKIERMASIRETSPIFAKRCAECKKKFTREDEWRFIKEGVGLICMKCNLKDD